MKAFCIGVFALVMLCCFGIEGSMRKLHAWGKSAAATAQRVSCDLNREACDYLEAARLEVEERKAQRRRVLRQQRSQLSQDQWEKLEERSQEL